MTNFEHYQGDSLTHPMLISVFINFRPVGHRELRKEYIFGSPHAPHMYWLKPPSPPNIEEFLPMFSTPMGNPVDSYLSFTDTVYLLRN